MKLFKEPKNDKHYEKHNRNSKHHTKGFKKSDHEQKQFLNGRWGSRGDVKREHVKDSLERGSFAPRSK